MTLKLDTCAVVVLIQHMCRPPSESKFGFALGLTDFAYVQVCGLKWSPDDRQIASGGNDNQLYIWNQQSSAPVLKFSDHTAAVKAIAWSPHQHGLLASGGGTADRCIRFWNTTTSTALNHLDTGATPPTMQHQSRHPTKIPAHTLPSHSALMSHEQEPTC